jgi:hypothetical protein
MAKIFKDTNALNSLRSSDVCSASAYGKIIDKAIEANEKNIRLRSFLKEDGHEYCPFEQLAFAHDGDGIEAGNLSNYMTIN